VSSSYLFRFDGSRDNDDYLEQGRSRGYIVFVGIEMRVSAGWVPDFMRVVLDEPTARCTLTLVELEADANSARVSARKYLPESASSIVEGFLAYLERALAQCRATADPRHKSIHELITTIRGSQNIALTTAGALRNQFVFIEELPLIDQGPVDVSRPKPEQQSVRASVLQGQTILVPIEHKVLFRAVLILDAVVRGWDKSGASLRAWRNLRSQPLKAAIRRQSEFYPELTCLLLSHKTGLGTFRSPAPCRGTLECGMCLTRQG
jgi:hypothetical protein